MEFKKVDQHVLDEIKKVVCGFITAHITSNGLVIIKSSEKDGMLHLSVSHKERLPSYEEMKEIRYSFGTEADYMAEIFPPMEEFVNIQENTRHLFELDSDVNGL